MLHVLLRSLQHAKPRLCVRFLTHYEVLRICDTLTVTDSDIKRAYLDRVKECHPDINPGNEAAARQFQQVQEAHDALITPNSRSLYNAQLEKEIMDKRIQEDVHGSIRRLNQTIRPPSGSQVAMGAIMWNFTVSVMQLTLFGGAAAAFIFYWYFYIPVKEEVTVGRHTKNADKMMPFSESDAADEPYNESHTIEGKIQIFDILRLRKDMNSTKEVFKAAKRKLKESLELYNNNPEESNGNKTELHMREIIVKKEAYLAAKRRYKDSLELFNNNPKESIGNETELIQSEKLKGGETDRSEKDIVLTS